MQKWNTAAKTFSFILHCVMNGNVGGKTNERESRCTEQ